MNRRMLRFSCKAALNAIDRVRVKNLTVLDDQSLQALKAATAILDHAMMFLFEKENRQDAEFRKARRKRNPRTNRSTREVW